MTGSLPPGDDAYGDGTPDSIDNWTARANPDQRDTDEDGFGNACDGDFDQYGVVDFLDLGILETRFLSADPDADLTATVSWTSSTWMGMLKSMFLAAPGPDAAGGAP